MFRAWGFGHLELLGVEGVGLWGVGECGAF